MYCQLSATADLSVDSRVMKVGYLCKESRRDAFTQHFHISLAGEYGYAIFFASQCNKLLPQLAGTL